MTKPSIGRVVWYRDGFSDQPEAAIVAYVHDDALVNLGVFRHNGNCTGHSKVTLWHGEGDAPPHPYCEWMPYQKGQAAKTEALEAKIAGG